MAINELRAISTFVTAAELGSLRKTAAAPGPSPHLAARLQQHLDRLPLQALARVRKPGFRRLDRIKRGHP